MRRAFAVAAGVALAGGVIGGQAGAMKASSRTVVEPYAPNPLRLITVHTLAGAVSVTSIELDAAPGELAVEITLEDDSGMPVRGSVGQARATLAEFCGETTAPVRIDSSLPVEVQVFSGNCDGEVTVATEGTVEARFLRGPRR